MGKIKCSPSVQAGAGRFLSGYGLTFEQLTDAQQKHVVHYIRVKKWWPWALLSLLVATIGFGYCTLGEYFKIQEFIGKVVVLSNSGTEIDWQKVSGFSLEQGFLIGSYAFVVVYMIMFSILIPISIRNQKQTLAAFLPSITSKPVDGSDKQN